MKSLLITGLCMLLLVGNAYTQDNKESRLSEYQQYFKKDYFKVGALMQFVFDYQNERTLAGKNGFNVANMRLNLKGEFDFGMGYFFHTNFLSSRPILDAYMYYKSSEMLIFQIGQFKAPFSTEFLTPASDIDFVNRSQVVSGLAPKRQIGFELKGAILKQLINYNFGIFNGNGTTKNNNDNNEFLYAGRLAFSPNLFVSSTEDNIILGINAAISKDSSSNFYGSRTFTGMDFRINYDKFLFAGEYIQAKYDSINGSSTDPKGYYVTIGYKIISNLQFLLRWDNFDADDLISGSKSDQVIFGINFWPTGTTEFQFNYLVNTDNNKIKNHQILINSQIVF